MRRSDSLYEFGVVIQYNINPIIKGMGSAIFLHVWRDEKSGTAGCVAIARSKMIDLLNRLDPKKNPHIVLNPS